MRNGVTKSMKSIKQMDNIKLRFNLKSSTFCEVTPCSPVEIS
jgi:hypothetical protein